MVGQGDWEMPEPGTCTVSPQSTMLLGIGCAYYYSFSRHLLSTSVLQAHVGSGEMHPGVDYNPSFRAFTGLKGDRTDADQSAIICKLVVTIPGTLTPASIAG